MVRRLDFWFCIGILCFFCTASFAYPPTFEQRVRFKRYLPNTFPKLEGHDPVYVVAIGGGNLYGQSPNQKERKNGDILNALCRNLSPKALS